MFCERQNVPLVLSWFLHWCGEKLIRKSRKSQGFTAGEESLGKASCHCTSKCHLYTLQVDSILGEHIRDQITVEQIKKALCFAIIADKFTNLVNWVRVVGRDVHPDESWAGRLHHNPWVWFRFNRSMHSWEDFGILTRLWFKYYKMMRSSLWWCRKHVM